MLQTTIAKPSSAEGVGLHTGVYGHISLVPAPADTGIVFRRIDLDNFPIEAQEHNVARVSYATSLMKQGVLLSTTEHLLAAIYSCGIDNVYVDIDTIEVPILDGSAEPFMQMLQESGTGRSHLRSELRWNRCRRKRCQCRRSRLRQADALWWRAARPVSLSWWHSSRARRCAPALRSGNCPSRCGETRCQYRRERGQD